jgi:hypothetical protein
LAVLFNFSENYGYILAVLGGNSWLFFFAWFRWYFKCPHCKNTIYGLEVKGQKKYYWCVMMRILKYHRFTCMYCHGHFILGKYDKVKEKGWSIENMHEPDFTVIKNTKIK